MKRSNIRWKRRRNLFLTLLLIIIAGISYWVYQYNSGLAIAEKGPYKDDQKTFKPFEGADLHIGEMNVLLIRK